MDPVLRIRHPRPSGPNPRSRGAGRRPAPKSTMTHKIYNHNNKIGNTANAP